MINRDMKNYRAPESVHLTRLSTYLIIAVLVAVLAWATERDNHLFNTVVAEVKS